MIAVVFCCLGFLKVGQDLQLFKPDSDGFLPIVQVPGSLVTVDNGFSSPEVTTPSIAKIKLSMGSRDNKFDTKGDIFCSLRCQVIVSKSLDGTVVLRDLNKQPLFKKKSVGTLYESMESDAGITEPLRRISSNTPPVNTSMRAGLTDTIILRNLHGVGVRIWMDQYGFWSKDMKTLWPMDRSVPKDFIVP